MKTATWMIALALGASGCSDSMMSDHDQMQTMLDEARGEADRHRGLSAAAGTLEAMRGEMSRHEGAMAPMMDGMAMEMGEMSHCSGAGMQDLRTMHAGMAGEMGTHRAAMEDSLDVSTAMDEVGRHSQAMEDMLGDMQNAMGDVDCM